MCADALAEVLLNRNLTMVVGDLLAMFKPHNIACYDFGDQNSNMKWGKEKREREKDQAES